MRKSRIKIFTFAYKVKKTVSGFVYELLPPEGAIM